MFGLPLPLPLPMPLPETGVSDFSVNFRQRGKRVVVTGKSTKGTYGMRYLAACPPDARVSRSGSNLPFANPDMAFEATPNVGVAPCGEEGDFEFSISYPNSYYRNGTLVPPTVFLQSDLPGNHPVYALRLSA
ncbi:MAG: hypothetical protein ACYCOU_01940 [Sulfobacillus sp.]